MSYSTDTKTKNKTKVTGHELLYGKRNQYFETTLEKLARVLSRRHDINVVIRGNQACTDGKTIWLPMMEDLSEELFADLNGFLDHEVAHIKYTDFTDMAKCRNDFHRYLLNAVEDSRIEILLPKEYRGCKLNLDRLNHKWRAKMEEQRDSQPWTVQVITCIREIYDGRPVKSNERIQPIIDAVYPYAVKLPACKSSTELRIATAEIIDIIGKARELLAKDLPEMTEEEKKQLDEMMGAGLPMEVPIPLDENRHEKEAKEAKTEQEMLDPQAEEKEGKDGKDTGKESEDGTGKETEDKDAPAGKDKKDSKDKTDKKDSDTASKESADKKDGKDAGDKKDSSSEDTDDSSEASDELNDEGEGADGEEGEDSAGEGGEEEGDETGDSDSADGGEGREGEDESATVGEGDDGSEAGEEGEGSSAGGDATEDGADADAGSDTASMSAGKDGKEKGEGDTDHDAGKATAKNNATGQKTSLETRRNYAKWAESESEKEMFEAPTSPEFEKHVFSPETYMQKVIDEELSAQPQVQTGRSMYMDESIEGEAISLPYTRQHDSVEDYSGKGSTKEYAELKKEIMKHINPIKQKLERELKVKENRKWRGEQERGMVNSRSLARLATDKSFQYPFKVFSKTDTSDVAVTLLLDCSGSMTSKMRITRQTALALGEALKSINIAFEVLGFNTGSNNALDAECRALSSAESARFNRFDETLDHFIFKDFEEQSLVGIVNAKAGGCNADGESITWAAQRLALRKEKRKILMILSDGQPSYGGANHQVLAGDLRRVIRLLPKSGIEPIGVGILTEYPKEFYPNNVIVNNLDELSTKVVGKIAQMLRKEGEKLGHV
jgi:cobalamin biosynthesis protein CobT